MPEWVIEGSAIHGIDDFYAQLNRLLMAGEDWELGPSLDALNDVLWGGIGAMQGQQRVRFVWRDHAASRRALGRQATEEWLRSKAAQPQTFNAQAIHGQLRELRAGTGPSYFDLILQVFADHSNVELVLS